MTKQEKIEQLLDHWTEAISLNDLIDFYRDRQAEFLETKTDEEVDGIYKLEIGD